MEIKGDNRVFLLVNTTDFNGGTEWGARDSRFDELTEWGFDEMDIKHIDVLIVGDVWTGSEIGVLVIRVA